MPFIENLKEILLDSLNYPAYARPEYFIKKQIESGWSKEVFIQALKELCKGYRIHNGAKTRLAKGSDPLVDEKNYGLNLAEESKGRITEFVSSFGKTYHLLTNEILSFLTAAIEQAEDWNERDIKYSDLQIVSFFESAIHFIKQEIEVQAEIKEDPFVFGRTIPKGYTGFSEDGEKVYLLHNYYVKAPWPFFNFYTFKHAIRNLLLNSQHVEKLRIMLKSTVEDVKTIVTIWNDVLHTLSIGESNAVSTNRYITFTADKASFTASFGQDHEIASRNKIHYTNYEFVKFASAAGHIVENEVMEPDQEDQAIPSVKGVKPRVAAYALMHVYWSRYDESKAITKTNKLHYSEKYSISDNTLFTEYVYYSDKKNREQLPEGKKEMKSSVVPFVERFEEAVQMLQEVHSKAYREALNDLNWLKMKYSDFLN